VHIASFLPLTELLSCNYVSEGFNAISRDHSLWSKFFVQVNTATPPPEGRLCHTGVVHGDKMYVFGGHTTKPESEFFQEVKQDLHSYDFATRAWNRLSEMEAPRTEHTTVTHGDIMYVFGGYAGNGYENSVLTYTFSTNTWGKLDTTGDTPTMRSAHTAVVYGKSMYVFGGWDGTHCMNDLYELNLETLRWSRVNSYGEAPCARCSHGSTVYARTKSPYMTIFGGYAIERASEDNPTKGYLNDLYEFYFETKTWVKVVAAGQVPSPRSRFKMVSHKDSIYLFAGWNSLTHFNSLFRFSHGNKRWTEVSSNFDADGIGQFSLVVHKDVMYAFSGFSPRVGSRSDLFARYLMPRDHQAM